MDIFILENSGWMRVLHWFAKRGGWKHRIYGVRTDFCHWVRRLLWGITWILLGTAILIAGWALFTVGAHSDLLRWVTETGRDWPEWTIWVVSFLALPGFILAIILTIVIVVAFGYSCYLLIEKYKKYRRNKRTSSAHESESQLRKGWRAIRNKYCIKIEVPEDMR
jgi:hypothetical protein